MSTEQTTRNAAVFGALWDEVAPEKRAKVRAIVEKALDERAATERRNVVEQIAEELTAYEEGKISWADLLDAFGLVVGPDERYVLADSTETPAAPNVDALVDRVRTTASNLTTDAGRRFSEAMGMWFVGPDGDYDDEAHEHFVSDVRAIEAEAAALAARPAEPQAGAGIDPLRLSEAILRHDADDSWPREAQLKHDRGKCYNGRCVDAIADIYASLPTEPEADR